MYQLYFCIDHEIVNHVADCEKESFDDNIVNYIKGKYNTQLCKGSDAGLYLDGMDLFKREAQLVPGYFYNSTEFKVTKVGSFVFNNINTNQRIKKRRHRKNH